MPDGAKWIDSTRKHKEPYVNKFKLIYLKGNMFCVETPDGKRTRPSLYTSMLSFHYNSKEYWAVTPYFGGDGDIVKVTPVGFLDVDES